MVAEELDGEIWIPTQASAGIWNADVQRFELLFAVNVANGRFFGAQHFTLDATTLAPGAPLPDQLTRVTHGSLEGALAHHDGTFAVAYNDSFTELDVGLVTVVDGTVSRFVLGGRIRSRPLLARLSTGLAVVSAHRTEAAGYWEDALRMRCDLR